MDANPLDTKRLPAVYAILQGGGVKGSALVGALEEALKYVEIAGIGGTSAGAIVAALFATEHSPSEIKRFMLEINYRLLARRFRFWLPRRFGLHSSEYIYTWIRDRISMKLKGEVGQQICFSEIAMPLRIVAADIRNQEEVVFSQQESPNLEVAAAVRRSMSIPFFYEMITDGPRQYVDGGIISNFPLWLFDEERWSFAAGVPLIGFQLQEPKYPSIEIKSWRQYARGVANTVMGCNQTLLETAQRLNHRRNVISIPTGNISSTDLQIDRSQREWLYEQGVSASRLFFATQSVGGLERVSQNNGQLDIIAVCKALETHGMAPSKAILEVCRNHLYRADVAMDMGTFTPIIGKFYVDLMEAALEPLILEVLAKCMEAFIATCNPGQYNIVAGIKMGNPILAAAVAQRLKKGTVLVKNIFTSRGGYPFDGQLQSGDVAILVDDVSSDGVFLRNAVRSLRAQGVHVASPTLPIRSG
jgi:NTE family protein